MAMETHAAPQAPPSNAVAVHVVPNGPIPAKGPGSAPASPVAGPPPILARLEGFRVCLQPYFAEAFGTMILIVFGCGANASVLLNADKDSGSWLSINIGWGLGVAFGCLATAGISGAHVNPAVSIALACFRGFPWRRVPGYIVAQVLGSFLGAACVYLVNLCALSNFDGGERMVSGAKGTSGIFVTAPQPSMSMASDVFSEVLGTAILLIGILSITDNRSKLKQGSAFFLVGMLVVAIGISLGITTGYAINPARDFGPRLFLATVGYHGDLWGYAWNPILSPILGAILGAGMYDFVTLPSALVSKEKRQSV